MDLSNLDLINKEVKHKSFGTGRVTKHYDSYIEIQFSSGNKKFVFPDAFKSFLKLNDEKVNKIIKKTIQEREEKRQAEMERQEKKAMQLEEQRKSMRKVEIIKSNKIHPSSQVVFWCKEQDWDKIFTDWSVFTGVIKSGLKKGEPKRLPRIKENSACLLTARESDMSEKDRYIKGVYMVDENFNGKSCKDGYIPAHPKYRLRLSEQESVKMLFWNYYFNEKSPDKITWNTGKHRYFDNVMMAQILLDIISLKKEPKDREFVEEFFEYFCQMNQIDKEKLSKPNGALMRA